MFGLVYEESEAYHIWASGKQYNITVKPPDGESYGIDINQGYFALQYGITEQWAADLNIGAHDRRRGAASRRQPAARIHHRADGLVVRRPLPDLQRSPRKPIRPGCRR